MNKKRCRKKLTSIKILDYFYQKTINTQLISQFKYTISISTTYKKKLICRKSINSLTGTRGEVPAVISTTVLVRIESR